MARRRKTPQFYYNQQKQRATAREIEWQFTFETWWPIWRDSGKWSERGRGRGQYVMARNGDTGPYAPWNVSIMEAGKNGSQALKGWSAKKRAREDRAATEIASGPTMVEDLKTPPSSPGCTCGKEAANSAADTAIAAQTVHAIGRLYDRPRSDASSHNNGTFSHKVSGSANGASAIQRSNKNLDQEKEIGVSLLEQMVELLEIMKKFLEKNFTKQNAKRPRAM